MDTADKIISNLPYILSAAGLLISFLSMRSQRKVNQADYAEKISKAATDLLEPYQVQVDKLQSEQEKAARRLQHFENTDAQRGKELIELNIRIRDLLVGIQKLIKQIRSMGAEPVWQPLDIQRKK